MTAETLEKVLPQVKKYARVDYTDDDDLVQIMIEAAVESMAEVIPNFDADGMTGRQLIVLFASVKNLYDDREKYGKSKQEMKRACSSMLLSEIYEPKEDAGNE